jgi:hypothetical protein
MVGAFKKKLVLTERRIRFYAENMNERNYLEELCVNGRTIGNVFKEIYEIWTRFISFRKL